MHTPLVVVETYLREGKNAAALDAGLGGRPVHRLPAPELGEDELLPRVATWVDTHEKQLVELGLQGPVLLAGWSFGGVVALELARRLVDRGAPVEGVLLLDSSRPRLRPRTPWGAARYYVQEATLLADGDRGRDYLRAASRSYLKASAWRIRRRLWRVPVLGQLIRRGPGGGRADEGAPQLPQGKRIPRSPLRRSIHRAYLNYRATWVTFPVGLLTTEDSMSRASDDPTLGWAPYLRGGYQVRIVPSSHRAMWKDPDLVLTVAAVADLLEGVEASTSLSHPPGMIEAWTGDEAPTPS